MRIIAGSARGIILKTPRGCATRPSAGRVKEALFSILGERVIGAVVLDLFAGSGSLGLEALSRGSAKCYFIDISRSACHCIRENIARAGFEDRTVTINAPVHRALVQLAGERLKADLVFLDPPYKHFARVRETLESLVRDQLLNETAIVALEHGIREILDPVTAGYLVLVEKKYGDSRITLLQQE